MGLFFIAELRLVLFGESDLNPVRGRHFHGPLFLKWGRGGLRRGLFFIIELPLVLFGESDLNPVTGRHSHGPLWSSSESLTSIVTGRHSHVYLLGVEERGVEDGLVLHS